MNHECHITRRVVNKQKVSIVGVWLEIGELSLFIFKYRSRNRGGDNVQGEGYVAAVHGTDGEKTARQPGQCSHVVNCSYSGEVTVHT